MNKRHFKQIVANPIQLINLTRLIHFNLNKAYIIYKKKNKKNAAYLALSSTQLNVINMLNIKRFELSRFNKRCAKLKVLLDLPDFKIK